MIPLLSVMKYGATNEESLSNALILIASQERRVPISACHHFIFPLLINIIVVEFSHWNTNVLGSR